MIETRMKQIFDYLTLDYDYHTSKEIGKEMELSSKTIRKEIDLLNSIIKEKGAIIESKTGKGFIFKIKNQDKFKSFLKNDWYKYAYFQEDDGSKDIRYENILRMLLFSNSYIKQYELAEIFHVSESQINKDLPIIKKTLNDYKLNLISKPYYGMKVEGSEKNIRLAIKNEIGEDPKLFDGYENKGLFNKIQEIINDIDFGEDYYMPYVNFKNLVIHIYISILRIKQKEYVKLPKSVEKKLVSYEEFKIANKIVDELQAKLEIEIPNQELVYITMHLIAKNTIRDQEKLSSEILELSQNIIDEIYKVSKYDFRSNIEFYFALATHLGPLIYRIKYGFNMKNPILEDIKKDKISFMLATIGSNIINDKYMTKLSDDEIGYIALHIMAAIGNNSLNKKNILIVCGSGNSSAQIMKSQLIKQFKGNIENITTTDVRNLRNFDINKYDLIISSININDKFNRSVIYVDVIFSKSDLNKLKIAFENSNLDEIYKIFLNSIFVKDMVFKNKDEVLKYIADKISTKSNFLNSKALKQLRDREKMGQTSFDNIAIPHIVDQVDGKSYSIIIILKKPIDWDGRKIRLIYSLVIGKDMGDMKLYYDKLGNFLSNKNLISESLMADDKIKFMNIFLKEE
ncbi:MAG: BglG family transcription antiterminator [Anaerococcus vaginalis]|nr:BglG family transcription antiterminator [Anaerococcus vaginalis]MDU7162987.1 BglG family transcription antiterminator [Anaerococcus vaginalis]